MKLKIITIKYLENEEHMLFKFCKKNNFLLNYDLVLEIEKLPFDAIIKFNDNTLDNIHKQICQWKIADLGGFNYYALLNFGIWTEKILYNKKISTVTV